MPHDEGGIRNMNQVHAVTIHGGLVGLFLGGAQRRIQGACQLYAQSGEEIVFVLPDQWSAGMHFLSSIILLLTLLLWCPQPGYLVITRRGARGIH